MGKVVLCALSDLPPDRPLQVQVPGRGALCVYRFGEGAVLSKDCCPHNGAPLSQWGEIEDDAVVCMWHGCRFDLRTGTPSDGPCPFPLEVYECEIEDGKVCLPKQS